MENKNENSYQQIHFSFAGYFLKESSYSQKDALERKIDRFELKVQPIEIQKGENRFDIFLHVFSDNFDSHFVYTCLFDVKAEGFPKLTPIENEGNQRTMVAVAFPFVRQAIASATADFLSSILLPIVDVQSLSIFSGVSFVRADLQKKKKDE